MTRTTAGILPDAIPHAKAPACARRSGSRMGKDRAAAQGDGTVWINAIGLMAVVPLVFCISLTFRCLSNCKCQATPAPERDERNKVFV